MKHVFAFMVFAIIHTVSASYHIREGKRASRKAKHVPQKVTTHSSTSVPRKANTVSPKGNSVSCEAKKEAAHCSQESGCSDQQMVTELLDFTDKGDIFMMGFLINSGVDVNAEGYCGYTPLRMAVRNQNYMAVRYLVYFNVNLDGTGLRMAIKYDDERMVQLLINSGVDINKIDKFGNTFLTIAATEGSLEAVKIILKSINQNLISFGDILGKTAKDYAMMMGHAAVYQEILQYEAKLHKRSEAWSVEEIGPRNPQSLKKTRTS